jgi:23S rRNA pseudouridine1911/1915/1917 synthase
MIVVDEFSVGLRIDKFLQDTLQLSRQRIQSAIKDNYILVNNRGVKPAYLLQLQDNILVQISKEEQKNNVVLTELKIDYLYEDKHIVVLNKPINCIVQRGTNSDEPTLIDYMKRDGILFETFSQEFRDGIVHRLDRLTEGIMVVAKTKVAHEQLSEQFKNRLVQKKYYAMLKGNLINDRVHINQPIGRHFKDRYLYTVTKDGKEAITDIHVIKRYGSMSLCDVEIKTGRTHQIRVHAKFIGHPVLDDPQYGAKTTGMGQRLQAYFLAFFHPETGQRMAFVLPISGRVVLEFSEV